MESTKQQDIMVYFNKKDKTKTSETDNSQNGNEASISRATVSVEQTTVRKGHVQISQMSQEEVRNEKGNLSGNTIKNTWSLVLL